MGNCLEGLFLFLFLKMSVCHPEISNEVIVPGIDPFHVRRKFCGEPNKVLNYFCNMRLAQGGPLAGQSRWRLCGEFSSLRPSNWGILLEE